MFVSDKELFRHSSNVTLNVVCRWGDEWNLSISAESKVEKLKMMCITHFKENGDSMKQSTMFSLVSVRLGNKLDDTLSLLQNGIADRDELLLIKNPSANEQKLTDSGVSSDGPDFADIERATADVPEAGGKSGEASGDAIADVLPPNATATITMARELQPIFVCLVEQAQRVLCLSADAAKLFASVQAKLREPRVEEDYPPAEPGLVTQLYEMGFERKRAVKALRLHHNVVSEAMDWLLVHEGEPSADEPLPTSSSDATTGPAAPGPSGDHEVSGGTQTPSNFVEPMSAQQTLNLFREYNRRQFRPLERVKMHFMEMGFDETTVVDALRICNNDQQQAMEFLLNDRGEDGNVELKGLSTDSPMYKALLEDPVIQLGLTNPSTLFAFLSILDSPHSSSQWLNNPEVGPVLVQISRLYHAEYSSKGQNTFRLRP